MKRVLSIAAVVVLLGSSVFAMPLLSPGDFIIAIDLEGGSEYPAGEAPSYAIDGTLAKYLNFGKAMSGFIVTPSMGASTIESFQITTANDAPERDPLAYWLLGTNDAIVSADNSDGRGGEVWQTIAVGVISLPEARDTVGDLYSLAAPAGPYTSYKMYFLGVKGGNGANSMQIAEIQFFGTPEPATLCVLGLGGLGLLLRRRHN